MRPILAAVIACGVAAPLTTAAPPVTVTVAVWLFAKRRIYNENRDEWAYKGG